MKNPKTQLLLSNILPLVLFGLALMFRLDGIRWGLPHETRWYSFHPDERQTIAAVASLDFFSGDFNPNFFNYPSLFLYLAYIAHFLMGGFGLTQAITPQNAQWALSHDIILAARFVSALLGAATVFPVYAMARKLLAPRLAGFAAFALAMAPAAVQHSHFATVDVACAFFVAMSLMFCVRAMTTTREYSREKTARDAVTKLAKTTKNSRAKTIDKKGARENQEAPSAIASDDDEREYSRQIARDLLLSALFAGLAAATKYNAILVFVAPLVAWWLLKKSEEHFASARVLANLFAAAIGGFLFGCPFSVLSFREFWGDGVHNGFAYELFVHSRQGSGEIFQETGNGWIYHLAQNLPFALGMPLLLVSLLGVFVAAREAFAHSPARENNSRASRQNAADVSNAAQQNAASAMEQDTSLLQSATREYSRRATLPLLAFCVLYFLAIGTSQVRFMRYVLPLVPALCVFASIGFAAFCIFVAQKFSRMEAPRESFVFAIERSLRMFFLVAFFLAALNVNAPLMVSDTRDDAANWLRKNAPSNARVALAADRLWFSSSPLSPQNAPPDSGLSNVEAFAKQSRFQLSALDFSARRLAEEKPQFVVMNEFEWRDKVRLNNAKYREFMELLTREYSPPQIFSPPRALLPGREFAPHDFLYTWPQTRVYTRK